MTEDEKLGELSRLLADPTEDVRVSAVRALAQKSAPKAVELLLLAVNDASPNVRMQAAAALSKLQSPVAAPAIGLLLADELRSVRQSAAVALAELGDPGFTVLAAGAQSENPLIRQSTAFGLAHCPGEQSVRILIAGLLDSDENVRYYAADSLGIIGSESALQSLVQAFQRRPESENVLRSISDAIVRIDGGKARELLLECANHGDETVRQWASVALEDLEERR